MFFLGQIGLGWVQRSSKVALKKKGALFGHSSLHRSGYASQRPRGCLFGVCVLGVCVQVCARTFSGLSASEPPVMPPPALWHASSGTLAFSLRLMPPRPVADSALTHADASAALHPTLLPLHGPISFTFLPRSDLHYIHLQ